MKVELISCDDWEALYVDGRKIVENHSLSAWHVLNALAKSGVISELSTLDVEHLRDEDSESVIFYEDSSFFHLSKTK
ncbi:hypothetical protein [Paenibacillus sp. Mc5Re-14]|uniref:hypothetical protein n=1 Tax=Paenibacillus sp. Mc5Re-14 TaxID=1030529 RepID=UPI000AEBC029|nr:hypothetical protein [Paenibacillus sp. Mc5Re-14]